MSIATRAIEYPHRKRHLLPMPAGAAGLAGIGRIDFDERSASFFRFARELGKECRPRGICNAFRQTIMVDHAVDMQVFNGNHAMRVDDLAALLVGEVLPSPCNPLMDTRNNFAMLPAFRRAFLQPGMLALHFYQRLFFSDGKSASSQSPFHLKAWQRF